MERMNQERLICCCGPSGWTKVIGWLEIIGSVYWIINISVGLSATAMVSANDDAVEKSMVLSMGMTVLVISLMANVLSFVMGIVLVQGSFRRNPRQLYAWRVYTSIYLVFLVIFGIIQCFLIPAEVLLVVLILLVIVLAIEGFFLWVVGIHQAELEAATGHIVYAYSAKV